MAKPNELLSIAGQEPSHLPPAEGTKVGGPTPYSTAAYANWGFDADPAGDVKTDTTILPNAVVKAEPMPTIDDKNSGLKGGKEAVAEGEEKDEEDKLEESENIEIEIDGDLDAESDDDEELKEETLDQEDTHLDAFIDKFENDTAVEGPAGKSAVPATEVTDIKEEKDGDDEADDDKKEKVVVKVEEAKAPIVEEVFPKVKIKISLTEDVNQLFANDNVLTEDQKRQTRTLFEAALRTTTQQVAQQINAAYKDALQERTKLIEQKMIKGCDKFLNFVAEQWAKDNKVSIQSNVRAELVENFVTGLHKLFTDSYVDVPASKVDLVSQLRESVASLETKLRESEARALETHQTLKEQIDQRQKALLKEHKARLIAEAASELPLADRGKFTTKAKNVRFSKTETFRSDLVALRESFVAGQKPAAKKADAIPAEAEALTEAANKDVKAPANAVTPYVAVLDRMV